MRFLKRLLIGLVLLVAAFATVVWFQPDDYRLTRSTVIAAPAATIFQHVNDLRQWEDWSPWAKLDPAAKVMAGPNLADPSSPVLCTGRATCVRTAAMGSCPDGAAGSF